MRARPPAGAGGHRVELQLGAARHLLRTRARHRAVDALAAHRGARRASRIAHLLASSAIPFVFPAVPLDVGGQPSGSATARCARRRRSRRPCTWARERMLVIGAGRMHEPPGGASDSGDYPSLAQIAGHALSNIFLDALAVDVERLQRINTRCRCCRRSSARADDAAADRRAGDRAQPAPRRHRRAPPGQPAGAGARDAARRRRLGRRAPTRAARRWPATCCSRRRTRAR